MARVDLRPRRVPAAPFIDNQLDLMLAVELAQGGPLVGDELFHPIAFVQHLIPLVMGELERVPGRAAIIMRRPALERRAGKVGPLLEEPPRPIEVVAIWPRSDQIQRYAVTGNPLGKLAILAAVVFRCKLAAAAPAFI